jgi:hypothetical protein
MADPVSVNTVERLGSGTMIIASKTFTQATVPWVKVFFISQENDRRFLR